MKWLNDDRNVYFLAGVFVTVVVGAGIMFILFLIDLVKYLETT